jgi:hypothetical protein
VNPIAIVTDQANDFVVSTRTCKCCDLPYVEEALSVILLCESIPAICPECIAKAEEVAGEDALTELLADLDGDLYYATIIDINYLLNGGDRLWN